MNNYLYHSGVKGMKWGIRKDSKRTAGLRQQYRSEKDTYKKELLKAKYQDSKIRDRIDQNGLSKRQEKLKNKYMAKGMSKQSAEIAAVKRTDLEKKLLIGAALAGSVAAAYAYRNHLRYTTGDTLDENSVIGRITKAAGDEKVAGFYVYTNEKDKKKYNTLLVGEHMFMRSRGVDTSDGALFRKSFQATGKLKIASPNDFNKIAYEQYEKDKDFKNTVNSLISTYGSNSAKRKYYADRKLSEREIGDVVNRANVLRSHNDNLNSSYNKMYDALKKKGYSGFIDINDRKYSGYNSKRPTVIIDPDAIKRKGEYAISGFETLHAYHGYMNYNYRNFAYRTIRALGVLTASISAIGIATNNHDTNRAATNYYKRTNDSSKGLKEASILENKYNADRLLRGNRGSY